MNPPLYRLSYAATVPGSPLMYVWL
jgi:hypothetical protein